MATSKRGRTPKASNKKAQAKKVGRKPVPVKKVKNVKPEPEPIESEQEVEFDDTEHDGHDEFDETFPEDEPEQEGA